MTDTDWVAVETALQLDPVAIAEAEEHLKKGLLILSRELGLDTTRNLVAAVLTRLEDEMPARRTH